MFVMYMPLLLISLGTCLAEMQDLSRKAKLEKLYEELEMLVQEQSMHRTRIEKLSKRATKVVEEIYENIDAESPAQ